MNPRSAIATIILLIFVSLGIGFFAGFGIGKKNSQERPEDLTKDELYENPNFKAGWNTARERLKKFGLFSDWEDAMVRTARGKIESMQKDKLIIELARSLAPFADPSLDKRQVLITEDTEIQKRINKDKETLQKEGDAFQAKLEEMAEKGELDDNGENGINLREPLPYTMEEASVKDLKPGQMVEIKTENDIKDKKSFKAATIIIEEEEQK